MIRALVNKSDHSVSLLEINGAVIPPSWAQNSAVYLVTVDEACLEGIEPEFLSLLFYSPEDNTLYRDRGTFVLDSAHGKDFLRQELQAAALLPVEARTPNIQNLIYYARMFLSDDVVDEILADDVLSDSEISDILSYLNDDS